MSTIQTYTSRETETRPHSMRAFLSGWKVPLVVAAIWMLLLWSVHRQSPRTLVSFHGLLHAAIVEQLLSSDGVSLPPENPFFAGHPVSYYYFFHMLAAQLVRLFGLNVFHAMEALILFAAGSLLVLAVTLGRKLFNSTSAGVLMGYLILAGTNPLGVFFALYKVARTGMHALDDDPNYLWGVVHPLYSMIRYNDIGGLYGPLINFFLNITSRPAALAALLLAVLCFYQALVNKRRASWIFLGLAFALTTALNPIIGLTTGGALGAGLVSIWLWGRWASSAAAPRIEASTILTAILAIVAGVLMASPTYYHLISGPSSNHPQFWLFSVNGLRHLLTVALSILPLLALALFGLLRAPQDQRVFLAIIFLSAIALLGLCVMISLSSGNQSNMFHAAAVLLAVPAAGAVMARAPTVDAPTFYPLRAAVIAVIFMPTLLTLLASYAYRPPVPASFESIHIERVPRDSNLALLYQWARNETDPKSVFVIDPRERVAVCGNTAEFPAMAGRVIFTEHFSHYLSEPYADSKLRFDLAVRLVSGEQPSDLDRAYLSELNRPIYIVCYMPKDVSLHDRMSDLHGQPLFHQGQVSVYDGSVEPASLTRDQNGRINGE